MKKLLPHIFFILVLLQAQLYNSFVVAGYEFSYDYYSQELCENQDQPELHCEGKCFLSKQLSLSSTKQKQTEPPVLIPVLKVFPSQCLDFGACALAPMRVSFPLQRNFSLFAAPFLAGPDHPPRVSINIAA